MGSTPEKQCRKFADGQSHPSPRASKIVIVFVSVPEADGEMFALPSIRRAPAVASSTRARPAYPHRALECNDGARQDDVRALRRHFFLMCPSPAGAESLPAPGE